MADAVTATLVENGPRNFAFRFTNFSDGSGETGVVKVDGSATGPLGVNIQGQTVYPLANIKVTEIDYDIHNSSLRIIWGASPSNADLAVLGGFGTLKFKEIGGLPIPTTLAGATGQILFTFAGVANASYTVVLRGTKGIPQS